MKLAEEAKNLAGTTAHQASEEGEATPSISESCTMPATLPTSAHDEMIPAEARDDLQITAHCTQADTTSNHTTPSLHDNATGEDDSQCADNIAAAAGSTDSIQGSSVETSTERALTGEEVVTSSLDKEQATEAEARDVEQKVCMPLHLSPMKLMHIDRVEETTQETFIQYQRLRRP
ncbi:hypothetical protein BC629DRAFT_1118283 [Irpex lacteus]|nr:hypothetical protein BC629DRAFT_1118283 [Irpex lacteus]